MNRQNYCISASANLAEALQAVDNSHKGYAIAIGDSGQLLGTLTDGDIRRAILKGATLIDKALPFVNSKCTYVLESASREEMLKLFDQRIRFLPVVDPDHRLIKIISIDDLKYFEAQDLTAKAKAPARISFGGGGTDLTPFFMEHGGAVLNATVNLYSRATLKRLPKTRKVVLKSDDLNMCIEAESWDHLRLDGKLDLLKAAIRLLQPAYGFELTVASDFPPSSGLGGSSVVLASVIGAFNQFRDDKLSLYDIAELAFQAERLELGCSGGWQDQYAAVFGGINFMEFRKDRNEINSLKIQQDILNELEDRLVLCFSGGAHPVNSIHQAQAAKMTSDTDTTRFAHQTRELAFSMKHALQRGNIDQLGEMLHKAWVFKKNFSSDITNTHLDAIYDFARANGAVGGKILGAGGGGYFLFQASAYGRKELTEALTSKGYLAHALLLEGRGLQSWLVK